MDFITRSFSEYVTAHRSAAYDPPAPHGAHITLDAGR